MGIGQEGRGEEEGVAGAAFPFFFQHACLRVNRLLEKIVEEGVMARFLPVKIVFLQQQQQQQKAPCSRDNIRLDHSIRSDQIIRRNFVDAIIIKFKK